MAYTDTRNLDEIRRDADRARANLADTVLQLRESVSGAATDVKQKFSPDTIKQDMVDTARRNPLQTAAVGALVAWPAMRLVRSIPLPVLMIGAGLFLTGSKKGQELSQQALDRAADLGKDARRRAYDAADAASETASDLTERASAMAEELRRKAEEAAEATSDAIADAAARASAAASGLMPATDPAAAVDGLSTRAHDAMSAAGDTLQAAGRRASSTAEELFAWAKANPLLIAGLGVAAGGFIASALPPTQAERSVARTVSGAVRDAARHGVNAAVGVAAGAALDMARRAADRGLDPESFRETAQDYGQRAMKVAGAAADAAMGQPEARDQQNQFQHNQFKAGE